MALTKAVHFAAVLLVLFYSLDKKGFGWSASTLSEELSNTKTCSHHERVKRSLISQNAFTNATDYDFQVVISLSDRERLGMILKNLSFPILINSSVKITSIDTTTVCSSNLTEHRCECEESFAWSYNNCLTYGYCDAITGNTCGCINKVPDDGLFCQQNTSQREAVVIDVVLELSIPGFSVLSDFTQIRNKLKKNITFPLNISSSLKLIDANVTTTCSPESTELQCRCEDGFAWPCDMCTSNSCSNNWSQICSCVKNLPPTFCQPVPDTFLCLSASSIPVSPVTTGSTPLLGSKSTATFLNRKESFRINMPFNESYNQESSQVYRDVKNAIEANCQKYVSKDCVVQDLRFRTGSVIADYIVSAPSIDNAPLQDVKVGIFKELAAKNYPVEYVSENKLKFNPTDIFLKEKVKVTCGPPPESLNFGVNWTAEWILDDIVVSLDKKHNILNEYLNGTSTLTVSEFLRTDDGNYDCRLRHQDNIIFKESGAFKAKAIPIIQVTPVKGAVNCGSSVTLSCSVNDNYTVAFGNTNDAGQKITYSFKADNCTNEENSIKCEVFGIPKYQKEITLKVTNETIVCRSDTFGNGTEGFEGVAPCEENMVGEKRAVCKNGTYEHVQDNCILAAVNELLDQSKELNEMTLPVFLNELKNVTVNYTNNIVKSPATVNAIINVLNNVANTLSLLNITIDKTSMKNILETAGILTMAKESWEVLRKEDQGNDTETKPNPDTKSAYSLFLKAFEKITEHLVNQPFNITTDYIQLTKTTLESSVICDFNCSLEIVIPESGGTNTSITVILFASMDNVLPARDETNSSSKIINGKVVLIKPQAIINNISLTFQIINEALTLPSCVFWDFTLFGGLGGWSNKGCSLVSSGKTVSCNCNHTTSFSILMSPDSPKYPVLDLITYIGVGISIGSLVIFLIIEAIIWSKIRKNTTSYLRHVCIVNIAVSLLMANICFIIEACISEGDKEKTQPACTAATFFIHFFYLALFFWMFASALLLLYRTVSVFDGGLSNRSMLAIGFFLGYGAPLIIATITIAVTAPLNQYTSAAPSTQYIPAVPSNQHITKKSSKHYTSAAPSEDIREESSNQYIPEESSKHCTSAAPSGQPILNNTICWLNWEGSKALLAFVIPAFVILVINLIILIVVIYKMLRRKIGRNSAHAGGRHVVMVITRSLTVLTPFFGLTWSLGAGTMAYPKNKDIHIAFALLNSLQGFFILVFGTLSDKKVMSEIILTFQDIIGNRPSAAEISSSNEKKKEVL